MNLFKKNALSHNDSYGTKVLSTTYASGDVSTVTSAPSSYGLTSNKYYQDVFKEETMSCGSGTCYAKVKCNEANGWYASTSSVGSSRVSLTTTRNYAYTQASSGAGYTEVNSGSTRAAKQTCYHAKPASQYFCIKYNYKCGNSSCDDSIVNQTIAKYDFALDEATTNVDETSYWFFEEGTLAVHTITQGKKYCYEVKDDFDLVGYGGFNYFTFNSSFTKKSGSQNYFYSLQRETAETLIDAYNIPSFTYRWGDHGTWTSMPTVDGYPTVTIDVNIEGTGTCKPISTGKTNRCIFVKVKCHDINYYTGPADTMNTKINTCIDGTVWAGSDNLVAYTSTQAVSSYFTTYTSMYNENTDYFSGLDSQLIQNGGDTVLLYKCNLPLDEVEFYVSASRGVAPNGNDGPSYQSYRFYDAGILTNKYLTAQANTNCFMDAGTVYPYCNLSINMWQKGSPSNQGYTGCAVGGIAGLRCDDVIIRPRASCGGVFPKQLELTQNGPWSFKTYLSTKIKANQGANGGTCISNAGNDVDLEVYGGCYETNCTSGEYEPSATKSSYYLNYIEGSWPGKWYYGPTVSHSNCIHYTHTCSKDDISIKNTHVWATFDGTYVHEGLVQGKNGHKMIFYDSPDYTYHQR